MHAAGLLLRCFRQLGWCRAESAGCFSASRDGESNASPARKAAFADFSRDCWLSWFLYCNDPRNGSSSDYPSTGNVLTLQGRNKLSTLVQAGWTLRDQWPRSSHPAVQEWLGKRLYFTRTPIIDGRFHLASIVSSQLGRQHQRLRHWPHLLDWTLRALRRDRFCLLSVPKTTLHEPATQFARSAQIRTVELSLPSVPSADSGQMAQWLSDRLEDALNRHSDPSLQETIFVSPECEHQPASDELSRLPVQDRASISLADRVFAVSVRNKGNIARLLEQRLKEPHFPLGSLFIVVEHANCEVAARNFLTAVRWLGQGAVGWVVLQRPLDDLRELARCHVFNSAHICRRPPDHTVDGKTLGHLCAPASRLWTKNPVPWPYLTHCTRGSSGRLPHEAEAAFYDRLWQSGTVHPSAPLVTLVRIMREQRLRGTSWLTRGNQPSVSLSAVPLPELLNRRRFQPHLGRWDWEPYGFLFHQQYLLDARPVIYGKQSDFLQLPADDQVYFQPIDSKYDWSQEREWRVLGDLDLGSLPSEAVTIFVRSRLEAVQLARESRFPVIWTEGILP